MWVRKPAAVTARNDGVGVTDRQSARTDHHLRFVKDWQARPAGRPDRKLLVKEGSQKIADAGNPGLRIHIHDNSGHPFQIQLSRELARRGHTVRHTYMATFQSPKGPLAPLPDDPPTLRIEGLDLGAPFPKYAYWRRWRAERRYGDLLAALVERERPDVLLAANTPLEMLDIVQRACRRRGVRFVFWVQDLYGYAISQILGERHGAPGRWVGKHYLRKERRLLRCSDHAIAITEDFRLFLHQAGLPESRVSVIPNWGPLAGSSPRSKSNPWCRAQGLEEKFVYLYAGTLGLKHDPGLLLSLADQCADDPRIRVVVISEGLGADWLRDAVTRRPRPNLLLLPFQRFEDLPDVLGSADVLVALLQPGAGVFSVPSKILSYLCAGKPVLLAAPPENQAARLITEAQAGIVCAAGRPEPFLDGAKKLTIGSHLLALMGQNAWRYAERHFSIESIAGMFEQAINKR